MPTKQPSNSEQRSAAAAARDVQYFSDRVADEKKRSSKIDRLRAQRLEKEAAEATIAAAASAEKSAVKKVRAPRKAAKD